MIFGRVFDGGGCVVMDERRVVALSGVVVASTAGLARLMRQYLPEDGSVDDGGGDL